MRSRAMPAASSSAARSASQSRTSATTSSYEGASCIVAGSPCMCMATRPQSPPASRTARTMAGSRKPDTSFTMAAPASRHARATPACRVSMLTHMPRAANSRTTGSTRANSSSSPTGAAPGRVDSPPTSMMRALSSTMRSACASAAASPSCWPPSEKESGVTLRMPMTMGILVSNS